MKKFKKGDKAVLFGSLHGFLSSEAGERCPVFSEAPVEVMKVLDRGSSYQNVKVRVLRHKIGILIWEGGATGWAHSMQLRRKNG